MTGQRHLRLVIARLQLCSQEFFAPSQDDFDSFRQRICLSIEMFINEHTADEKMVLCVITVIAQGTFCFQSEIPSYFRHPCSPSELDLFVSF